MLEQLPGQRGQGAEASSAGNCEPKLELKPKLEPKLALKLAVAHAGRFSPVLTL